MINSAVTPGWSEKIRVFRPSNDALVALVGNPNGVGGVYLLMEHKRALGLERISRMVLILDGSGSDPYLIYEAITRLPLMQVVVVIDP